MNAKTFSDTLLEAGRRLGTASAEFQCLPRNDRSRQPHADPLLDLITNYDTSTFASGGIDFHPNPRDLGERIEVGRYHGDLLVMLKDSGPIVLEELGTNHHVLCPVAESGYAMLDALLISSIYLGRATLDEALYDEHLTKCQAADQSAAAAGGDEYQPFFQMLLGANLHPLALSERSESKRPSLTPRCRGPCAPLAHNHAWSNRSRVVATSAL